jgi:hypothetical protein
MHRGLRLLAKFLFRLFVAGLLTVMVLVSPLAELLPSPYGVLSHGVVVAVFVIYIGVLLYDTLFFQR